MTFAFSNSYARLPENFYSRIEPAPVPAPAIVRLNEDLAQALGLDLASLKGLQGAALLSGQALEEGSEPLAMAYAGHQFGNWVPQLGDGRAVLLGEIDAPDGTRFDIHLKGSGLTPYSRGGDGKAVLSAVLREYIVSEAMVGLKVPTTRSLAVVATGETVMRAEPSPGAILTRVAGSHIRVGTFQYLYAQGDIAGLQALLDYVIDRHYSVASEADVPALAVLRAVMKKQADLIAHWMQVGFIHGVMNTDNMAISGETIDYGPCAFLDAYHPTKVFSSIDHQGRYAFANQPPIAHWNLAQFAQSLLPLIPLKPEEAAKLAQEVLDEFPDLFKAAHDRRFGQKLGLDDICDGDRQLTEDLLEMMSRDRVDFTILYTALTDGHLEGDFASVIDMFDPEAGFPVWLDRWQSRNMSSHREDVLELMKMANPRRIARNHRVEQALEAGTVGNFEPLDRLLASLKDPFATDDTFRDFETAPMPEETVTATFCGT